MGCSTLHIKTEVECRVLLFDEDKGIAKPGSYFNLEVRKGEQDLLFVSTNDESLRCQMLYNVEENDCDYRIMIGNAQFKQYSQVFLETMRLAELGNADAQSKLGEYYYNGNGVEQDYSKAVEWLTKAAEQGFARAQCYLGVFYHFGQGVEQDYPMAVEWYTKAAEQGDETAQCNLGYCYKKGQGVEQDYQKAVEWYTKAAVQGYARAQSKLGYCYYDGQGVEQDYQKAVEWYTKAAEQGNANAQNNLGVCYKNGQGVEKNYQKAVEWYTKAAEQGNEKAKRNLEEILRKRTNSKSPYYLFFDTETTGVPKNYNSPASDTNNWPRLVQLGWILTDKDGNTLNEGNEIVRPEGFVIPTDAANVHGITTERAIQIGKPLQNVIEKFLKDVKQAQCFVGHNISFDQRVVGAELYRLGLQDIVSNKQSICTMQSTIDYCKIPGNWWDEYKYPKLQELYTKLFGCKFEDAHDAMADITATKKCFFELKRIGVIKDEQE